MKPVAVDTNLLVRLATGDNAREHHAVTESLARRGWRVFPTVILEAEWVLRSRYGFAPAQFADFVDWMQTCGQHSGNRRSGRKPRRPLRHRERRHGLRRRSAYRARWKRAVPHAGQNAAAQGGKVRLACRSRSVALRGRIRLWRNTNRRQPGFRVNCRHHLDSVGARSGSRTRMALRPRDFKSLAYTSFAIRARAKHA